MIMYFTKPFSFPQFHVQTSSTITFIRQLFINTYIYTDILHAFFSWQTCVYVYIRILFHLNDIIIFNCNLSKSS